MPQCCVAERLLPQEFELQYYVDHRHQDFVSGARACGDPPQMIMVFDYWGHRRRVQKLTCIGYTNWFLESSITLTT